MVVTILLSLITCFLRHVVQPLVSLLIAQSPPSPSLSISPFWYPLCFVLNHTQVDRSCLDKCDGVAGIVWNAKIQLQEPESQFKTKWQRGNYRDIKTLQRQIQAINNLGNLSASCENHRIAQVGMDLVRLSGSPFCGKGSLDDLI